jgi:hypothetical protein
LLCVAACIVAALLGGALLSARHGTHRFYCPDKNCRICFTVAAYRSAVEGWGLLALGIALFTLAFFAAYTAAGILAASTQRFTLHSLGVRLNS